MQLCCCARGSVASRAGSPWDRCFFVEQVVWRGSVVELAQLLHEDERHHATLLTGAHPE